MEIKMNLNIFAMIIIFYLTGQLELYGIFMFFIFLHEMAHLLVGIFLKFKPKSLHIMPLGLAITFQVYGADYNCKIEKGNILSVKRIAIALAGPCLNLILAFCAIILNWNIFQVGATEIFYGNIILAMFNLLPIYPLDGGRIVKEIIHIKKGLKIGIKRANEISNIVVCIITMAASIWILYEKNIAILLIVMYLWGLLWIENKKVKRKMKIYELIEKEESKTWSNILQNQDNLGNSIEIK